jgi:hypothetical protein
MRNNIYWASGEKDEKEKKKPSGRDERDKGFTGHEESGKQYGNGAGKF